MKRFNKGVEKGIRRSFRLLAIVLVMTMALPILPAQTVMADNEGNIILENNPYKNLLVNKIIYQVTKEATKKTKGEVMAVSVQVGYNPKSLTFPSTITYNSKKYKVTAVGGTFDPMDSESTANCDQSVNLGWGKNLSSVMLPSTIKYIEFHAFTMCDKLESINIPQSVKTIGQAAFYNCSSLKEIILPKATTIIGEAAFSGCTSLTSLKVASDNSKYKTINNALFSKDGKTLISYPSINSSYNIPDGVTTIGIWAFENSLITSVTMPDSVTTIEECAFFKALKLEEVSFGNSVTSIGTFSFYKCTALTQVTLNKGIQDIGMSAFQACSSLESVYIPESVSNIPDNIFAVCKALKNIEVDPQSTYYKAENGMLLTADGATLIAYPTVSGDYTIPATIKYIGEYAFQGTLLTSVTIPSTVQSIDTGAFMDCTDLQKVTFMSRDTDINPKFDYDFLYNTNGMFSNTSENLVIIIPRDTESPKEPKNYKDELMELLSDYSSGKAEIIYAE